MNDELEKEISAAKVRLGFGPDKPVHPSSLVADELPRELVRPFWDRQFRRWSAQEGSGVC